MCFDKSHDLVGVHYKYRGLVPLDNVDNQAGPVAQKWRRLMADQTEEFLCELADLSHKYNIGITGSPTLFVLERDDFALAYGCDDESKLTLA